METPRFFPASKHTQKVSRYGCDRPLPVGFDGTYLIQSGPQIAKLVYD